MTLLELAQAVSVFARGGRACKAHALPAEGPGPEPRVFSEETAFLVTSILNDERLRMRAFGADNPLLLGYPFAVKTGTSSNWRDSWAVGYGERATVAVWTGDFSGRPMEQLSGAIGAGPLFHKVADLVVKRGAVPRLPMPPRPPAGVEQVMVCALSGMAPTAHCPHERAITVARTPEPCAACDWHAPTRIDKRNGLLASDRCPAAFVEEQVFERLPPRFAAWSEAHPNATKRPPTRYSPLCPSDGVAAGAVVITQPRNDEIFVTEPGYARATQTVALSAEVDPAVPELRWLVDGRELERVAWPYGASLPLQKGRHRVEAVAGSRRSEAVHIEVR